MNRVSKLINHLTPSSPQPSTSTQCSSDLKINYTDPSLHKKKYKILITSNFYPCTPRIYNYLKSQGHQVTLLPETNKISNYRSILISHLKNTCNDYDGILNAWTLVLDNEIFKLLPNLKIVSCISAGFNNVDINYCKLNKINVTNISPSLANTVADYVVSLILVTCRNVVNSANILREKGVRINEESEYFPAFGFARGTKDLYSATVGIIGLGNIGRQVSKRLSFGFGTKVYYYEPPMIGRLGYDTSYGATYIDNLDELYSKCDIIVPLCPLLKSTKNMFNLNTFKKMGKNSILINVARGGLVNTNDLIYALKNGIILSAGLDVTEPEPLPIDNELYKLNNCTIVPHIGSATESCRNRMLDMAVDNLLRVLNGVKCSNIVV